MSDLKNILIVHENCGFFGGAEQNIYSVAKGLSKNSMLSFLYFHETTHELERFKAPFRDVIKVSAKGRKNDVIRALKDVNPDVIYIHKCLDPDVMEVFVESNIPTVHMVHDHEGYCLRGTKMFPISRNICDKKSGLCCLFPGLSFLQRNESGKLSFCWKSLSNMKRLIELDKRCDAFIVASNYMKKTLVIQGYDEEKISVGFAVSPDDYSSEIVPSFSDENHILYVGQVIRGKGVDLLFKALKQIKTPYHLTVIGEGSDLTVCQKLVNDWGLEDRVTFCGFVEPNKMVEWYENASLGVVPSVWPEPLGMVGLEMMWNYLPVIGFDSGGISDWLEDGVNGYLVPHQDVDKLSLAIEALLIDKARAKEMGKHGRQVVESKYNFLHYMNFLEKIFKTFCSSKSHVGISHG